MPSSQEENSAPVINIPKSKELPDPVANKLDDEFMAKVINLIQQEDRDKWDPTFVPVLPQLPEQRQPSDRSADPELVRRLYAKDAPSTVQIFAGSGTDAAMGSGSFVDTDGDILTCAHVVSGASPHVKIMTFDRGVYDAEVVKVDTLHDLALLRTTNAPKSEIKPIQLAQQAPTPSDLVFSLGSPQKSEERNPKGYSFAISPGIYDHPGTLRESLHGYNPIASFNLLSQKDLDEMNRELNVSSEVARVNIDHGSSGGPLVNEQGQLVGVNDAIGLTKTGDPNYKEAFFGTLHNVKSFLASTDKDTEPKVGWQMGQAAQKYAANFLMTPLETAEQTAEFAVPTALVLSGALRSATAGIPVVAPLSRATTFLGRGTAVALSAGAAVNDGYDLLHANNWREGARYGLAVLGDAGVMSSVFVNPRIRGAVILTSLGLRLATEFLPTHQGIE
jgi:S1-C subfamily serine protease